MSIKNKFFVSGIMMIIVPILVIFLTGIGFFTWFFIARPECANLLFIDRHFDQEMIISDPLFFRVVCLWAVVSVVVIMISSIFIISFQTGILLKSLSDLKNCADNIKTGNLDFEVMTSPYEEINKVCIAFEEMRKRLKEMNLIQLEYEKERNMLIANVSHDLRTPITSIKGYVEGIMDGIAATPEKREEYLHTIYLKAETLEALVKSMNEFSAYEMQRVRYNFQFMDIVPVLSSFMEGYRLDLEAEGMLLHSQIPQKELIVMLDEEKFCRVLANIVGNAVKYRKSGESVLEVTLEEWNDGVCVVISDDGKGISGQDIPKVFESHFRADPSRNSQIQGHGLGLSIAKQIVEAHKGKIWLRSEQDVGTTIYIYLPLRKSNHGEAKR